MSSSVVAEALSLRAADGYKLAAYRYQPRHQHGRGVRQLVVAGATGVPQSFYRRFAQHAAGRGYSVLTLDYRGIGLSAPASLRGFRMDYRDWARQDLAAAVDAMEPGQPIAMIGHSYGGHALGLMPNHDRIHAFYTFATGAGWHGYMPRLERWRVLAMWRVIGPVLVQCFGYLAWSRLGMGADLPRDVFEQWRRWCSYPRYFFDDPETARELGGFAQVRMPIVAANALDDAWATPASRDAFMAGYRNASWQGRNLDPRHYGLRHIGHMGYFRAQASALWDEALDWLDNTLSQR